MDDFELPDIGLIPCTLILLGLNTRCGAGLQLVDLKRSHELILTVRCELGHEAKGTMLGLFTYMDLATPALFSLKTGDFRDLETHVADYQMFVKLAAANGRAIDTSRHDEQLRRWARRHTIVPFRVWLVVREHWDTFKKPSHPEVTSWMPDHFDARDWT